jgi:diaminopimelate epimerase
MQLTKHHGLGNDFLVLTDPRGVHPVDATLARAVCDRHRGVGADGLLHLGPGSEGAEVTMVLLNADGGRAEMSGNGIGCLVQAAVIAGIATGSTVTVRTDAGIRTVAVQAGQAPRAHLVTVDMGVVEVGDDEPEWVEGDVLRAARADVGNPHLVLQAGDVDALADREWIAELGRRANAATPGGVNVEVVASDDGETLVMDVYERGVGLTQACGTGAVAAAAVARRWELVGDHVTVRMPGGPTRIDLSGPRAFMTTPITYVAAVEFPCP